MSKVYYDDVDSQVQALIKLVQEKKGEIQDAEKPQWITNCAFSYIPGEKVRNIATVTSIHELVDMLAFLLNKQDYFIDAAKELGIASKTFKWLGYSVSEWLHDFTLRINKININVKRKELEKLEKRLDEIISPELKRKMEIEKITNELKNV